MSPTMKASIEFRPMQGLLHIGEILAERFGLGEFWHGDEGIKAVACAKLQDMGVPVEAVPLTGPKAMTPLAMAEHAGFIKKRKRIRK
jgi:hypothetical protein